MSVHALHSKASIKGHPIHPMLVGFPIALYTAGLAAVIAYAVVRDPFWYRAGMVSWFVGSGIAALAAVFGAIDLVSIPRRETAARKTGIAHMGINLLTTALFAGSAFVLLSGWMSPRDATELPHRLPLVLGAIGFVLTGVAGALGWRLVQTHHVGIEDTAEHPEPPALRRV
jgi:uncharacterized membrane protein